VPEITHKKKLAVVVADVEVEDEYQFERRWYGSNHRSMPGGAKCTLNQKIWQDKWMGKRGGAIVEFGYTMSNNQIFAKGRRPLPQQPR
jgi:hypothetical protein